MTGELPSSDETPKTPPVDSSPAQPAEQADRTESLSPPASEPGKPSKPNAETRKSELQNEIQDLLAQRARLRADIEADHARTQNLKPAPDAQPAASSPAPARSLSETIQSPDITRAPLSDSEFFSQYPDATLVDLNRYAAQYQLLTYLRTQEATASVQGRKQTYAEKMADTLKTTPNFLETVDRRLVTALALDDLPADVTPTALNAVAQEIFTSDAPAALMTHLTAHPDELNRLLALPNYGAIARSIGRLEASLSSTAPQPAPAGDPVSLAPKPTPELIGKKPAQPADELQDAINRGDFARYKELTDRRELSRTA